MLLSNHFIHNIIDFIKGKHFLLLINKQQKWELFVQIIRVQERKQIRQIGKCWDTKMLNIQEETTQEYECKFWNMNKNKWQRKIIQIQQAKINDVIEIKYLLDGQILRREEQKDISVKPQVITNLEQIYYLEWLGKYQENFKKVGKWTANWNGKKIKEVGGYYSHEGQKIGIWNDIIINYGQLTQVYEIGEYRDNQKIGLWIITYEDEKIGGGHYNWQSKKEGQWIDLSDHFQNQSQVTYSGKYKNGKKVGRWDTFYKCKDYRPFLQMYYYINKQLKNNPSGGGFYEDQIEGDSIKVGRWIDISEEFSYNQQITLSGEYKKGKKFGKWDIWWRNRNPDWICKLRIYADGSMNDNQFYLRFNKGWKNQQIGGGFYDSEGYGVKIGRWIELSDEFSQNYRVIYGGEYHNGKKVGRWDILTIDYQGYWENLSFQQIGGGSYGEGDDEIKIGEWIEVDDDFDRSRYLFWKGEYKNGKKVAQWTISCMDDKLIEPGGGSYNEGGEGIKVGKWKEIYYWSEEEGPSRQNGEYKNGKRVGRWDIVYPSKQNSLPPKIGGGSYKKQGDGIKIGKWIEQNQNIFLLSPSIIDQGEYSNGIKVGEWGIFYIDDANQLQQIGGGSYDQQSKGLKIGSWIEINEWDQMKQIIQMGVYQNGRKVGQWMEKNLKTNQSHNITNYDI
ncbi:unnamed protein product [Paramecium octaurelia]|uniref:Uncharacterized protein n=1 Tax=Paramecium octaurelia TaxID=43137 RepID=A0A8S1X1R3_PAROT|nr:unnamed protein product [Paramecium octaurelia]